MPKWHPSRQDRLLGAPEVLNTNITEKIQIIQIKIQIKLGWLWQAAGVVSLRFPAETRCPRALVARQGLLFCHILSVFFICILSVLFLFFN